jgi:hypothetical protein
MPFIPTPNVVQVSLAYDMDGQHLDNTLWFLKRTGSPDIPSMLTLADDINAYWNDTVMPLLSIDLVFRGCIVTDQSSESAPAVNVPTGPTPGGIGTESAPNSVAFVVKFLTAGRGRSSRGRNYVPGIPNNLLVLNTIDGTLANDLVSAYQGILASGFDADWEWSVVSHFTGGAPRAAGLPQAVIGAGYTDLIVDSQRRRLPGRGT